MISTIATRSAAGEASAGPRPIGEVLPAVLARFGIAPAAIPDTGRPEIAAATVSGGCLALAQPAAACG